VEKLRVVQLEWPEIGARVSFALMWEQEPTLCEILWNNVSTARLKMACRHTLSTGEMFCGGERPPRNRVDTGTQANPFGRVKVKPNQIEPGSITYSVHGGYGGLSVWYGRSTETLFAPGCVVGRVGKDQTGDLLRAGKYVWEAQYLTHRLATMYASRGSL
jgi:hypothetical protein